jgi:hypothetical protein
MIVRGRFDYRKFYFTKLETQAELISDNDAIANCIGFTAAMDQLTFSEAEYQNKKAQDTPRNLCGTDGQANFLESGGEEGGSVRD